MCSETRLTCQLAQDFGRQLKKHSHYQNADAIASGDVEAR
jgi:hypothetical protein